MQKINANPTHFLNSARRAFIRYESTVSSAKVLESLCSLLDIDDSELSFKIELSKSIEGRHISISYLAIIGVSLQGIEMIELDGTLTSIALMPISAEPDIMLFYAVVAAIKTTYPGAEVCWVVDGDSGDPVVETQENFAHLLSLSLQQLELELQPVSNRKHMGIITLNSTFYLPLNTTDDPEASIPQTMAAMERLVDNAWRYVDVHEAAVHDFIKINDNKVYRCPVIRGSLLPLIVPKAANICLSDGHAYKKISSSRFVEIMQNHRCFKMIDAVRFIIEKMPQSEWLEIFNSVRGTRVEYLNIQ